MATKSLGSESSATESRRSTSAGAHPAPSRPFKPATQAVAPRLIEALAREGDRDRAERYLSQANDVRLDGDIIEVVTPSSFVADLISRRIGSDLCRVASSELLEGRKAQLRFSVDAGAPPRQSSGNSQTPVRPARAIEPTRTRTAGLHSTHRLEDFIVGTSNRLAHAAAVRLAEGEKVDPLSPLFIHSACGMGKTHLLHGIAARFVQLNPGVKVRCVSAESFTNEFISSLRAGAIESFRRAHRHLALLCIDDVHFLANKEATQTELLHTLDAVAGSGVNRARIALASDEHPRDIKRLSSALASRFMSGAVLRIDDPDETLRVDLVAKLGQRKGLSLDETGARALASASWKSVRELEGLFMQILAVGRLVPDDGASSRLDAPAVRRALELAGGKSSSTPRQGAMPRPRRPVPMSIIQSEVARSLRVELHDMAGKGRHKRVVLARAIVVHLARRLTTLSYPEIARAMGRPNHSSVITAHNRLIEQMKPDAPADAAPGTVAPGDLQLGAMNVEIVPELAAVTLPDLTDKLEREIIRLSEAG